ncbi:MAG: YnhF family membrane protein [Aeromonas sp.]
MQIEVHCGGHFLPPSARVDGPSLAEMGTVYKETDMSVEMKLALLTTLAALAVIMGMSLIAIGLA